ncbi:helix-turn-helix transcriptional regulator [Streptomyces sp. HNM0574]|uniref:helix-turn-helix domain-containing protein n=1 Tax=Streptomyces sp. HNM0574 TaxID=2714954 RepID=UPI00146B796D|nr:helix-turn-helix transcriptional regulator [Streptomyces sp. HNM0574]NLU69853.1 helix-turn-helix domain-containing protein [Streptomyces sp. HNM0574]
MTHHAPAVRRRKLGAELRRLRGQSGVTSGEAARLVGWHQSKVSRIETGSSGVKPADLERLLDAYGVGDPGLRTVLAALSGGTAPDGPPGPYGAPDDGRAARGWWQAYREALPAAYRDFIALESEAAQARTLETHVIPGLLQTSAYAEQVTRAALGAEADRERVAALVEVRARRQRVLRSARPLRLDVVLDEAALRREVGGREVMREQLAHLVTAGQLPHVRLQVLPFGAGVHIGVTGPFVIFSFSRMADLDVVVLDHLTGSLHLEQQDELRAYSTAFATLRARALSYDDSLAFLAALGEGR